MSDQDKVTPEEAEKVSRVMRRCAELERRLRRLEGKITTANEKAKAAHRTAIKAHQRILEAGRDIIPHDIREGLSALRKLEADWELRIRTNEVSIINLTQSVVSLERKQTPAPVFSVAKSSRKNSKVEPMPTYELSREDIK